MGIGTLDTALSGLRAAQAALDVTSNNIANASTPGFTRKVLPQQAVLTPTRSLGVQVGEITRSIDIALLRDLMGQKSTAQAFTVQEAFLSRIQEFHGPPESTTSISAQISKLSEIFSELSSTPESSLLLGQAVNQAGQLTSELNQFSKMLTQMRNDTQSDIAVAVSEVNNALEIIASANQQIADQKAQGRSIAALEDQRDVALQTVANNLDVSFFSSSDGEITVLTKQGETLADRSARQLFFNPTQILPGSFYPGASAGLFINSTSGTDITAEPIGGRIGELLNLRDERLPKYNAQLDELAQKLAHRFDAQGLTLFTDANGNVPANVADPGIPGYVGFAAQIQVNSNIVNDPTLIRSGTSGGSVQVGSSQVIRKIVEFAFGEFEFLRGEGTTNINGQNIFAATGITQHATVIGDVDLTQVNPLDTDPNITAGAQFTIDTGGGPQVITINAGDTPTDLVNNINAAVGAGTASLDGLGQLVLDGTTATGVVIADVSLGALGIAALGHDFGTTPAQDPSFTVQVGVQSPISISIAPTDTDTDLLAALNAVPGLTASLNGAGGIRLDPIEGGDITLIDGLGNPLAGLGVTVSGISHTAFRQNNLGPDGTVSTELLATSRIEDFARNMLGLHGEEHANALNRAENETVFANTLERRLQDTTGVDIDQEVAQLIKIQTAYTSAARLITVSEELLDQLFIAFGR